MEELLRRIVDERVKKPSALRTVRFECSHIISMAEAFCAKEVDQWTWDAIRKLNTLRNDIAHKLEPRGMKDRVDHLVSVVRKNSVFAEGGFGTGDRAVQFEYCLWVLFANLTALLKRPSARLLKLIPRK